MIRPLVLYSTHRNIRTLITIASGEEFGVTTRNWTETTEPLWPGSIIVLDLSDFPDADSVRDMVERFAHIAPSNRILFLIQKNSLLPDPQLLKEWRAEPLLPPHEARSIHLTLSRVAMDLSEAPPLSPHLPQPANLYSMTASQAMRDVYRKVLMVAPTRTTVLLTGETGTGKSYLAKLIHQQSARQHRHFVSVHCGAMPESLIESELFGHEKGAFTGATRVRKGKFELADAGTIFLDEIGTITATAQIKLLNILQEKSFERVGGEKSIPCDVRIIAATNEDPAALCQQGRFRWDLYYRLNVFPIEVPPLRQRPEDILALADIFIANFRRETAKNITGIHPRARTALENYSWPGNVRELQNIIERACILEENELIRAESLPLELLAFQPERLSPSERSDTLMPLHTARNAAIEEFERRYLASLLQTCAGSIKKSAEMAGITTRQLHKLMTRHNMDKKIYRAKQKKNP